MSNIEKRTQEIEEFIASFEGAISIKYRGGDEDANELLINGRSYDVEIYIYENEYHLFTSNFLDTYTEEEREEGKNHKTVKTMRGVRSYINKFALDM